MTLSPMQYPLLKQFIHAQSISIENAKKIDQRPFRSLLIRGYVAYNGRSFHITRAGQDAWIQFTQTKILRRNPNGPMTSYFTRSKGKAA